MNIIYLLGCDWACAREMVTCMLSFSHATARVSRGARDSGHSVTGSVAVATDDVAKSVNNTYIFIYIF